MTDMGAPDGLSPDMSMPGIVMPYILPLVAQRARAGAGFAGTCLVAGFPFDGTAAAFFFGCAGIGIFMPFMSMLCIDDCASAGAADASIVPVANAARVKRLMPLLPSGAR